MPTETSVAEPKSGPLKGNELKDLLKDLTLERGLDPVKIERFLKVETDKEGFTKADGWVVGTSMVFHLGTLAALNFYGDKLPKLAELPPIVHEFLQAVHNLTVNAANSPALRDHLPYIFLAVPFAWGAVKVLPQALRAKKAEKIARSQDAVKALLEKGEMNYSLKEGHTAAFVGFGDYLADRLQEEKSADDFIQYAHGKIDSQVWELLKRGAAIEEVYSVLDKGDFVKAGEVLLLPVKQEDMFLPSEAGHDMSLDETESLIGLLDSYCEKRGLEKKRVIIVGSEQIEETYSERFSDGKVKITKKSLGSLAEAINEERGATVKIIDPTELVMNRIKEIADGRELVFKATKESEERYGDRFFAWLENYASSKPGEKVAVHYNITDIPTLVEAKLVNDIAVILDPQQKAALLEKGMPERNIIVVPDLVLEVMKAETDKS